MVEVLIAKQWQMKEVIQLQSKAILKQYRGHTQAMEKKNNTEIENKTQVWTKNLTQTKRMDAP